ncbi:polysaccharide deacetylase family protein [Dactylosporangium sp. AC04546]|uniref:polysaccharide deacetylase family protein n=1 Tax=Dactylosporangium sp. AC04546 TaxID=2862460 RepID=UPI001EE0EEFD|nr:polysaccharide deacetylase family protein [Dactylosporangium sp. AC04546]WVK79903.1 polysaccharide deacetylase family protein [Dactylosporangium sp. AC04546]
MTRRQTRQLSVASVVVAALVLLGASTAARPTVTPVAAAPSPSTAPPSSAPPPSPPPAPPPSAQGPVVVGKGAAGSLTLTGTAAVALTFDDGPDPINTPRILQVLREHHVKATFCMVGFRVRDHPELVRQIAADGHTLCNHSWQHLLNLAKREPGYIDWDLRHTNEMIHAAVGADVPVRYFRAPGGNFTPELVAKARSLGMESIYWDVDPQDWNHKPDAGSQAHIARVVRDIQRHVRPGSIVLSHDNGQPDTIVVYQRLLPWLLERYKLEALPCAT